MAVTNINVDKEIVAIAERQLRLAKQGLLTSLATIAIIDGEWDTEIVPSPDVNLIEMLGMVHLLAGEITKELSE